MSNDETISSPLEHDNNTASGVYESRTVSDRVSALLLRTS